MLLYAAVALLVVVALLLVSFRQVTIFEYERGLRYDSGRFSGVLHPGAYWIVHRRTKILRVDVRPTHVTVPGQEVISADGVSLRITLSARYAVRDPALAMHSIASYQTALYTHLQLSLRELVAASRAEDIVARRAELGVQLLDSTAARARDFGLEVTEADIKDVMFPGDLKKVFSQVVRARQEGLAALEKARGESAALRSLANAATLVESRPALLSLRLLQVIGQDSGNTVMLSMSGDGGFGAQAKAGSKGDAAGSGEVR
jgi:regulator of protease activity HflC (stomatin/prohibitin superfamily)